MLTQKEDFLLNCPYTDRLECKSFGGKWDTKKKTWYVPAGIDILKFTKWWKIQDHPELYQELLVNYSKLFNSFQSTQKSHSDLQNNLISIKKAYGDLQETHAELLGKKSKSDLQNKRSHIELKNKLTIMKKAYETLRESYTDLKNKYMRLLINQADNNVNKTAQTSNSNIDNFQRNRTKIKNHLNQREKLKVRSSKNLSPHIPLGDGTARVNETTPTFKKRFIEETWGTRNDWRRDKSSWKKKNI